MRKWWQLPRPRCARGRGDRYWLQELVDRGERERERESGMPGLASRLEQSTCSLMMSVSFLSCFHLIFTQWSRKIRTLYIFVDCFSCALVIVYLYSFSTSVFMFYSYENNIYFCVTVKQIYVALKTNGFANVLQRRIDIHFKGQVPLHFSPTFSLDT